MDRGIITALIVIVSVSAVQAQGLPGDMNDDGWIGMIEMDIVLGNWGNGCDPSEDPSGNGLWDSDDLEWVLDNWGTGIWTLNWPHRPSSVSVAFTVVDNSSTLTGYVTQDLVVRTGTDWLSAQLIVNPDNPGDVYQHAFGSETSPHPASFDVLPALEFDTYVSNSVLGEPVIVTGAVDIFGSLFTICDEDKVSIAWCTTDTDDTGTLALARVTLTDDATGGWGFVGSASPAPYAVGGTVRLASGKIVDGTLMFTGDLTEDGFVGQDDLDFVLGEWGAHPPTDPRADPSRDNFVGQNDLDIVLHDWGLGTLPPSVPEPATLSLLSLGGLAVMGRKRR